MGLRSDLQDLLDLQALTGQFQEATSGLRAQAAQQVLNQQAPELIAQGNFGEVAGLAGQAGQQGLQTGIIEKLIADQTARAKMKAAPGKLTREQIIATLPPDLAANEGYVTALENAPDLKTQLQLKGQAQSFLTGEKNRAASNVKFNETKTQEQVKEGSKIIQEAIKPFEEQERNLSLAEGYLEKADNKAAFAAAKTFVARSTGNTGVLTDRDVEQYIGRSLTQDEQGIANYLNGTNKSGATPTQIATLQEIIKITRDVNNRVRGQQVRDALGKSISQNPRLFQDGKLNAAVLNDMAREGFTFGGLDEKGLPIIGFGKKTREQKLQGSPETGIISQQDLLKKIDDSKLKPETKNRLKSQVLDQNKQYDQKRSQFINNTIDQLISLGGSK